MKNSLLSLGMICALFATCASPAFAQYYQQNGASLSQAQSPMFQAPNYWGDARVKNRSSAISNSQGQGAPPMSGGRSGGGSNAGLGMLMIGPAMMLPAMMRSTLGGRHPNHKPRGYEDDAEAKKKKKKQKKSQQYSVNEEGSLPDPLYPRQGMTPLSRTTQDMQLGGGGAPRLEEQNMQVSGVVTDEPGQSAAGDF